MSRSPRPSKKYRKKPKRIPEIKDRLEPVIEDTQITAQPAEEAIKMHLDTGCSWIQPQFPEDK